jgi:hypothetical protein
LKWVVVWLFLDKNVDIAAALVPHRKSNTAVSAPVLNILEPLEDVWDARSAQDAAEDDGPETTSLAYTHIVGRRTH